MKALSLGSSSLSRSSAAVTTSADDNSRVEINQAGSAKSASKKSLIMMRFFFDRLRLQRNPRGVVSELLELGQGSIHGFNLARDQFEVGWRELPAGEQRQAMGKTILFQRTLLLRYYRQLSCGLSFRTV